MMANNTISQACCICADTYTTSLRKKINCPKCEFAACLSCISTETNATSHAPTHARNCTIAGASIHAITHAGARRRLL